MVVYLSTATSKEYLAYCQKYATKKIVYVQQQWDYTLCRAFAECYGDEFEAVTYTPIQTFPSGKCPLKKRYIETRNDFTIHYCGFINLPVIKQISTTCSVIGIIDRLMKQKNETELTIITHCFYPQSFLAIRELKKRYNVRVFTIIPDLPDFAYSNLNEKNKFLSKLWAYFNEMKQNLKRVPDGYICFSEYQLNYLEDSKPFMVMEGFADIESFDRIMPAPIQSDRKVIVYAGGLKKNYGVEDLVEAVHSMERTDCELWLYGEGESKKMIESLNDPRIHYKGCISKDDVIALEKSVYMLVNPRPAEEEYAKCSFPSKLLEYMSSGTPTLTTRLESMPEEYLDKLLFIEHVSPEGIRSALNKVLDMQVEELNSIALRSRDFVYEKKTPIYQAKRMKDFIMRCKSDETCNK